MIATLPVPNHPPPLDQRGFTMIELMVGLTLGMIVLAVVTTVFVNTSNNRRDTERVGRQIENGRYAIQVLADDLVNAGYFGEFDPRDAGAPAAKPDPCSIDVAEMKKAVIMHVQGYGPTATKPACISDVKPNTSVVVVRRVATCVAGDVNCDPVTNGEVYFQSSLCNTELAKPLAADRYVVAAAPGPFPLTKRGCAVGASLRRFEMHIYFVANNNAAGDGIPTLKRAELSGGRFVEVPLVDGIENLQVTYGLDRNPVDSVPDALTADPGSYGGCAADPCYITNWTNVVTARVHLLSRTTDLAVGQNDVKTYSLGMDEAGQPITVGPFNDKYKRHVYSQTVRMNNPAGRRE